MVAQNQLRKSEISAIWAQGVFEKDTDKVQSARDAFKRWNESNPLEPIHINFANILQRFRTMREDKAKRMAKIAPKEIRASVRRELKEASK